MRMGPRLAAISVLCVLLACRGADTEAEPSPADLTPADRAAVALSAPGPSAGDVHFVRFVARGDRYSFEPNELHIRPGDVVRFVQTGHQPQSVAFDVGDASAEARAFLLERGLTSGPLLTEPGTFFDVAFPDAPPGVYPFRSVPHALRGVTGRIVVNGEAGQQ